MTAGPEGKRLTIRADAGPRIGTGHVMRCLALAAAWRQAGGSVGLVSRNLPPGLQRRAEALGVAMAVPPDREDDLAWVRGGDVVVVDGWAFDETYLARLAECRVPTLVIDDATGRRRIPADFLLNQNIDADAAAYAGITGARLLVGPRYALLRPDFLRPLPARANPPVAGRLLLLVGGADPQGVSAKLLTAAGLAAAAEPSIRELRLVAGAANPALGRLREQAAGVPGATVLHDVQDMVTLMDEADLAVSASGSTVLELACRGVPMLLGALNEAELRAGRRLDALGGARALGRFEDIGAEELAAAILGLARDRDLRAAMSARARRLVDGRGAGRVVEAIRPIGS